MKKNIETTSSFSDSMTRWIVGLALFAGFILSILSWLEICVQHCSANESYRLFGLPFADVGIIYFAALFLMHCFSKRFVLLEKIVKRMIAFSLGTEIIFIGIQYFQIGRWCPVCLGIAFTFAIAASAYGYDYFKKLSFTIKTGNRGEVMRKIQSGLRSIPFLLFGLLLAFIGVGKVDQAQAAEKDIQERITFGTKGKTIQIYFASDWFCPSCRKVEFVIEKLLPEIQSDVSFFFIDYPLHRKSLNYSPFNLAFMVNDPQNYFQARHMLFNLAQDKDAPTDEDIQKAAKEEGIGFKELSYSDVKAGMDFFDKIVKKYNMEYTPTLIIVNTKTDKFIKLEGTNEITETNILKSLEKIKKK